MPSSSAENPSSPSLIKHDLSLFPLLRKLFTFNTSLINSKRTNTRITQNLDCIIQQWRQYKREWIRASKTSGQSSSRCRGAHRDSSQIWFASKQLLRSNSLQVTRLRSSVAMATAFVGSSSSQRRRRALIEITKFPARMELSDIIFPEAKENVLLLIKDVELRIGATEAIRVAPARPPPSSPSSVLVHGKVTVFITYTSTHSLDYPPSPRQHPLHLPPPPDQPPRSPPPPPFLQPGKKQGPNPQGRRRLTPSVQHLRPAMPIVDAVFAGGGRHVAIHLLCAVLFDTVRGPF
ncbi:hypothetical protein NL676_010352 [Syzygium grande]|nr:hypothetical protein NL676_010352 [Syzygium grande]